MTEPLPAAAAVAWAVGANAETLALSLPDGRASGPPEARAVVTGLPRPTMNGICAFDESATPAVIERSLDAVDAAGVPFALDLLDLRLERATWSGITRLPPPPPE